MPCRSSPADFSSRWCPRRAVPEEVNPWRGMLVRTCQRSSVSWVSLCVSLAGGGREWETVECAAARKSFACAL